MTTQESPHGMTLGKIDSSGQLHIQRAGKMVEQLCPFAPINQVRWNCGTVCPLFGEPREQGSHWQVLICQGRPIYLKADEREGALMGASQ